MHYDRLVESVRLLEGMPPANEARLSRRVRHMALAVDRNEDVAATMFLRRGVNGVPEIDVHVLELTDNGWRMLGGGSGPGGHALTPRPHLADSDTPGKSHGSGKIARQDNWIRWAELRLVEEVALLHVDDRQLPVPAHGVAVVVWTEQAPSVMAIDSKGVPLGSVLVTRRRRRDPESAA